MYQQGYQRNKRRLGKQRGAKVAQIDSARRLVDLPPSAAAGSQSTDHAEVRKSRVRRLA